MEPVLRLKVKICCLGSVEEVRLAIRHGAAALGLVSAMPSEPGVITEELIAAIAATVPPGVSSFLLTSSQDTDAIVEQPCSIPVTGRCRSRNSAAPGASTTGR